MSDLDVYLSDAYTHEDAATPEDAANIRRKCTYVRTKWYFPLLEANGHVPKGLTSTLCTPTTDLGIFEKLPGDIMNNILVRLDVKSFLNFRNANAKAHHITETILDCKDVMLHGRAAIINIARTGLSGHVTIGEIHLALTSPKCGFCDEYGSMLFLPTCARTCHECLRTSPRMAMIGTEEILPFYSRFGKYKGHGNRSHRTAASINFPYLNTSTGELEQGRSCRGCQEAFEEQSMQAMVPPSAGRISAGAAARDNCYSHEGFAKHFETCEHAQRVWKSRALPGRESWFAANGGMLWGIEERADYCQRLVARVPLVNNEEFWVLAGVAIQVVFYICVLVGFAMWH
ncbi:hypothetical protein FNYG_07789 [Fusarium nygamai]|uniref:F-box domain-containing protein n=1 Tax=Gibberella nygamai TaxID=42673 RepID=A0A2K0W9J7_GIBNY|nr:hypothetical protein FNYG_07789 [Fusarium nygamai]